PDDTSGEPLDLPEDGHGYPDLVPHDVPDHHDVAGDHDEPAQDGLGEAGADHLVGADPDVDPHGDDPGWHNTHDSAFPPPLGWQHVPEPVDGFPWSDPDVLSHDLAGHELGDPAGASDGGYGSPPVSDLFEYAGLDAPEGGDAWAQLLGSEDPATGALARWWAPGG